MANYSKWDDAKNILCVRLDSIGDVLMTTPAIRALKESCPGRRITLLTSSSAVKLSGLIPEIDEMIAYDAPWMKATTPIQSSMPEYGMAEYLKKGGYDAAVIFTVYSQNPLPAAFLCYLADIPLRLAYCRENPYQLLTHWIYDPEPEHYIRHEVQRQLDLVATIGCKTTNDQISLIVQPKAIKKIRDILKEIGIKRKWPWIIIHTGATAPSRRYPAENFATVGRYLVKDVGCQLILTGNESEQGLIRSIQDMMDVTSYSLAGNLTLGEFIALISSAPLLISNNTAPVHIASAFSIRVVDLYALTNPQHTPWKVPHRILSHDVPCKYCYKSICPEGHHNCLRLVPPSAVVDAVRELLSCTGEGLI